jgi:hypothetical protein
MSETLPTLDREQFAAWLRARKREGVIGYAGTCESCPLALYLTGAFRLNMPWVDESHYGCFRRDGWRPLPAWARRFVDETDTRKAHGSAVTAAEALSILETIP